MDFEQVAGVLGKMFGSVKTATDTLSQRKDHKVMLVWAQVYAEFNEWTGTGQPIVDLCMPKGGLWQGAPTCVPGTRPFSKLTMQKAASTGYLQISDLTVYSTKLTGTGQPIGGPSMKVPMMVSGSLVVAAHVDLTSPPIDPVSLLLKKGRWPDHVLGKTGEKPVKVNAGVLDKHVVYSASETYLTSARCAALDRALSGWSGNLRAQGQIVLAWGWRRAKPEYWTEDADEAVRVLLAVHQALIDSPSEIAPESVPPAVVATRSVPLSKVQEPALEVEKTPERRHEAHEPVESRHEAHEPVERRHEAHERVEAPEAAAIVALRLVSRSEYNCLQLPVGLKGSLDSWLVADGDRVSKNAPIAVMTVWFRPGTTWQANAVCPTKGVVHLRNPSGEVGSRNVIATVT